MTWPAKATRRARCRLPPPLATWMIEVSSMWTSPACTSASTAGVRGQTVLVSKRTLKKTQVLGKTQAMQEQLRMTCPQWTSKSHFTVLGCTLTSQQRQMSPDELKRLKSAESRARLIRCLPTSWSTKVRLPRALVVPKAAYGWVSRMRAQTASKSLFTACAAALQANRMANPFVRAAVYGGTIHLDCSAAQNLFRRACRLFFANRLTWHNKPFSTLRLLRVKLRDQGWTEQGPWQWKHKDIVLQPPESPAKKDFCKPCHFIRQRWRRNMLTQWSRSKRHEAIAWNAVATEAVLEQEIMQTNLQWARDKLDHATASQRAVLLGAGVSPAWLGKAHPETHSAQCPWCPCAFATFEHCMWECPQQARIISKPETFLRQRFAWPPENTSQDEAEAILQHMANVIQQLWLDRHGAQASV